MYFHWNVSCDKSKTKVLVDIRKVTKTSRKIINTFEEFFFKNKATEVNSIMSLTFYNPINVIAIACHFKCSNISKSVSIEI